MVNLKPNLRRSWRRREAICAGLLGALLALGGCDRDARYERPLEADAPRALAHHLVWLLHGHEELFLFAPDSLSSSRVALPATPRWLEAAPDGSGVALGDATGVTWVPVGERGAGSIVRYELGTAFSRVVFSPESEHLVLAHRPGATHDAGLVNLNQVAIIDLREPAGEGNPSVRTLRAFGEQPRDIVIGRRSEIGGRERQLTWALSQRYLVLMDLTAPDAPELSVHLTLEGDDRAIVPTQVVPSEMDGAPVVFIRATETSDIFLLTFPNAAGADEVPRPVLNQIPADVAVDDLLVQDVSGGLRVFAVTRRAPRVLVIEPSTGSIQSVELPTAAQGLIPFTAQRGPEEELDGVGNFALAYTLNSEVVSFIDLDLVERRRTRAISSLRLNAPITGLMPFPGRQRAIARMGDRGIALLDFAARTATPFQARSRVRQLVMDPTGDRAYVVLAGALDDAERVVAVDGDTGAPVEVEVPNDGMLLLMRGSEQMALVHEGFGRVSVLPRRIASTSAVIEKDLLFLEGVLDP